MTDTGGTRHHMHPAMLCIFFRVCPLGDFVGIVRLCLCLPRHSYHQICFRGQNTDGSSIHPACCSRHRRPTPVPILHLELPVTFQKKDLYLHNNCTTILFAKIDQLKNGNTFIHLVSHNSMETPRTCKKPINISARLCQQHCHTEKAEARCMWYWRGKRKKGKGPESNRTTQSFSLMTRQYKIPSDRMTRKSAILCAS